MPKAITIILEAADILQIINALESRADAYEKTATLMRGEYNVGSDSEIDSEVGDEDSLDRFFIAEECKDASEAEGIAKHFRDIVKSLERQLGKAK